MSASLWRNHDYHCRRRVRRWQTGHCSNLNWLGIIFHWLSPHVCLAKSSCFTLVTCLRGLSDFFFSRWNPLNCRFPMFEGTTFMIVYVYIYNYIYTQYTLIPIECPNVSILIPIIPLPNVYTKCTGSISSISQLFWGRPLQFFRIRSLVGRLSRACDSAVESMWRATRIGGQPTV